MRERIDDVVGPDIAALVAFRSAALVGRSAQGAIRVACESRGVDGPQQHDADDDQPAGIDPAEIDAERFERMVVDQLDLLPDDMVDGLDNLVFVTDDRPEDGSSTSSASTTASPSPTGASTASASSPTGSSSTANRTSPPSTTSSSSPTRST
nr:hypothetical protein GCM10025699_59110 [Microbacterium flavescens]